MIIEIDIRFRPVLRLLQINIIKRREVKLPYIGMLRPYAKCVGKNIRIYMMPGIM